MKKDAGFRSDVRSDSRTIGLPKSESQDSEAPRALPGGAGTVASATPANSAGGADIASVSRRTMSANDSGKEVRTDAAPAASPSLPAGDVSSRRDVCTDVAKLEPEWRELVEQSLVGGFTFDDVVEIFKERKGPRVTLHALEAFYHSRLDVQKRRIQHLLEEVEKLKDAMAHPETAEAQLADATLFTGLLRLSRRNSQLTVKDAQSLRMQKENLQLRKRILHMKLQDASRKKSYAHQRYLFEEARREKLILENRRLQEILKKLRQDETLPTDVVSKIQEIYGIVKQPYIPPQLAEQISEAPTS